MWIMVVGAAVIAVCLIVEASKSKTKKDSDILKQDEYCAYFEKKYKSLPRSELQKALSAVEAILSALIREQDWAIYPETKPVDDDAAEWYKQCRKNRQDLKNITNTDEYFPTTLGIADCGLEKELQQYQKEKAYILSLLDTADSETVGAFERTGN